MTKLYVKDLISGKTREYGTSIHDSLEISDFGNTLTYYNLQNGDGSANGEYRLCDNPDGILPWSLEEVRRYGASRFANIGGFKSDADEKLEKIKEIITESESIYCDAEDRLSEIREVIYNYDCN